MPPSRSLARAVSIAGHPLAVVPLASLATFVARGGELGRALPFLLGFATFGALAMAYSWWQVRQHRWEHVDASNPEERRLLNRFLSLGLAVGAALVGVKTPAREIALGLALSAVLVLAGAASARWCKLSLHVAFATYGALLLVSVGAGTALVGLAFAAAVAWSRLVLSRHVPRDLVAGAAGGAAAGLAHLLITSHWLG